MSFKNIQIKVSKQFVSRDDKMHESVKSKKARVVDKKHI